MATLAACLAIALALGSCSAFERDESGNRIPLDPDLRAHARRARANLAQLSPQKREIIEPILVMHERALREYDRLMSKGQTRRALQGPLYGAGAYIMANDVTGAGIADDVAIPFLALGAVAVVLGTSASASNKSLRRSLEQVKESARDVSRTYYRVDDSAAPIAEPGTRQHCIDKYVDCKLNGRRGGCQACMDLCMGAPFEWPDTHACDYMNDGPPRRYRAP